jgi:hypothetical protein
MTISFALDFTHLPFFNSYKYQNLKNQSLSIYFGSNFKYLTNPMVTFYTTAVTTSTAALTSTNSALCAQSAFVSYDSEKEAKQH